MDFNRRDALIGVGVTLGAALLVLFLKKPSGGSSSSDGSSIAGGFATAGTVYVPTQSTNLNYTNVKGNLTYTTTDNTTTTTYGGNPVAPPGPVAIGGTGMVNIPDPIGKGVKQPIISHPNNPGSPHTNEKMGNMHYATPKGGFNSNSVVDYIKVHGGYADMASRTKLAGEMGIKNYKGTAAQNQTMLTKLKQHYGN